MKLQDWFEKGLTLDQYKNGMNVNREKMESIYEGFQLNEEERGQLSEVKTSLKAIVLTEDWCGDAMLNIPILLRIAEEAKIDVRFVLRDSNLELMDQYLTNGTARSIPIFIFIDEEGQEKTVWGPRASEVQNYVDTMRSQLPDKEAEDFEEKQKAMYGQMTKKYQEDPTVWHAVASSIIAKVQSI